MNTQASGIVACAPAAAPGRLTPRARLAVVCPWQDRPGRSQWKRQGHLAFLSQGVPSCDPPSSECSLPDPGRSVFLVPTASGGAGRRRRPRSGWWSRCARPSTTARRSCAASRRTAFGRSINSAATNTSAAPSAWRCSRCSPAASPTTTAKPSRTAWTTCGPSARSWTPTARSPPATRADLHGQPANDGVRPRRPPRGPRPHSGQRRLAAWPRASPNPAAGPTAGRIRRRRLRRLQHAVRLARPPRGASAAGPRSIRPPWRRSRSSTWTPSTSDDRRTVRGPTSSGGVDPSMTMTTAGLCGLLITGMDLEQGHQDLNADGSDPQCGVYKDNEPVAKALNWIADRFPAGPADPKATWDASTYFDHHRRRWQFSAPFYGFYGIERAGRLTGQRFIGGHDWYRVGCQCLVNMQNEDGSWGNGSWPRRQQDRGHLLRPPLPRQGPHAGADDQAGLRRQGRRRLEQQAQRHAQRRRVRQPGAVQEAAAGLADLRRPRPGPRTTTRRQELAQQLLESPIVFFNGHDYAPRDQEQEILKQYLDNGGFVFAEACCSSKKLRPGFPPADARPVPRLRAEAARPDASDLHGVGQVHVRTPGLPAGGHPAGLQDARGLQSRRPFPATGRRIRHEYREGQEGVRAGRQRHRLRHRPGAAAPEAGRGGDREGRKAADDPARLPEGGPAPPRRRLAAGAQGHAQPDDRGPQSSASTWCSNPTRTTFTRRTRTSSITASCTCTAAAPSRSSRRSWSICASIWRRSTACCSPTPAAATRTFDASFRKFMEDLWADRKDKPKLEPIPPDDELYGAELNGKAIDDGAVPPRGAGRLGVDPEFKGAAGPGGRQDQRPLGGDLQPLRHRLRPGAPPDAGLPGPRLRQRRRALGKAAVLYALKSVNIDLRIAANAHSESALHPSAPLARRG